MTNQTHNESIYLEKLLCIETTVERILDHHVEFKNEFGRIREEIKNIYKSISEEVLRRSEGDAKVLNSCNEKFTKLYLWIAGGSIGIIFTIIINSFVLRSIH